MADVTVTAANVELVSGTTSSGVSGETITAGEAVWVDTGDSNKIKLADADLSAAAATVSGVAIQGSTTGNLVVYALTGAVIDIGGTVVKGGVYVLSATAGGVAPEADLASGMYTSILGTASSTTNITLDIRNSGITTT